MVAHLRLVAPRHENRTVPVRPANAALRQREYLTAMEVDKLMAEARRGGRYGQRDAALILIGYRHGLRAAEIADLEWSQVEFGRNATLHVRRAKNGHWSARRTFIPRSCPHAPAWLRLRARKCGPRHTPHSRLARPPVDTAHDALYRTECGTVQEFLAGLATASRVLTFSLNRARNVRFDHQRK